MNRKQTVMREWIILILVVTGLAAVCIFAILALTSGGKAEKETGVASEAGSETQTGAESEASAETQNDIAGEANTETQTGERREGDALQESGSETESATDPVRTYTLSFAGDCTIGSLVEWQGEEPGDFQSVVGINYAYPLSGVKSVFSADDLTVVNLEGTFTTAEEAVEKPYRFKADPAYVQVLAEGSVEAVSASNNHSEDFFEEGVRDTLAALDGAGIWYTRAGSPLIRELDGGLLLGIVSYNTVDNREDEDVWRASVQTDIETCQEAGCQLIIGFMHWGTVEYLEKPEDWEVEFAHDMADWGCDLIVGGHAHILQRMEIYHDVPIFYSMGNFCYGGHLNPNDKDSVIVQAEYTRDAAAGTVTRSNLRVIPCLVSSREDANDYCPTPCPEGSSDYLRILEHLEWDA